MQQPAGGTGYIFMFTMPLHPSRGGPSTRAAQAMALVAAHVTKEQVFNFLAHHQAIQQHCRQPRQSEQRRQSQRAARPCESRRRSRAGESRVATAAPRPAAAPPVCTGAGCAAGSLRPLALRSASAFRPPRSGSGVLRWPAAQPRPLRCALRGGAASGSYLCSSLPQPVNRVPGARLLTGEPPAVLPPSLQVVWSFGSETTESQVK